MVEDGPGQVTTGQMEISKNSQRTEFAEKVRASQLQFQVGSWACKYARGCYDVSQGYQEPRTHHRQCQKAVYVVQSVGAELTFGRANLPRVRKTNKNCARNISGDHTRDGPIPDREEAGLVSRSWSLHGQGTTGSTCQVGRHRTERVMIANRVYVRTSLTDEANECRHINRGTGTWSIKHDFGAHEAGLSLGRASREVRWSGMRRHCADNICMNRRKEDLTYRSREA